MKSPQILRGLFSAVWTATIATKYSFCSIFEWLIFRDLQNYLAKFSKICKILQQISDFRKNQHFFFAKIRKFHNFFQILRFFLQSFAKNQRFSQKSVLFLQKSGKFRKNLQILAIFCKILQLFQKIS